MKQFVENTVSEKLMEEQKKGISSGAVVSEACRPYAKLKHALMCTLTNREV